ncbi:hypothetical protein [Chondromyces crocatus]|uniref:PIN domain-containing protein n=1 Tax=Chondromyces crocatus TaxID=52 RepID=A0A0K1EE56_CHOCO|nr:hypothetical protein [Chondromyces crocatus]AKT38977.1 uncharacterized protein CMC5_031240 [Chondromyces crocatus]
MADHVVDTNVLLCASMADGASPFDGADHVAVEEQLEVLAWLTAFHADPEKRLVIDEAFRIYDEYLHKLTVQDYGLLVIHEKLQTAELVPVAYDGDGHGIVPEALGSLDPSDRKLAAAAIASTRMQGAPCTLVNATDTDWYDVEEPLEETGVVLEQLLDAWCRAKREEKLRRSSP